jgi:hypothetical protein
MVFEFVENDLKSLMDEMRSPFLQSEVKTLMLHLLSAVVLVRATTADARRACMASGSSTGTSRRPTC